MVSSAFEFLRLFFQLHLDLFKIVLPFVVNVILLALVAGPEANLHDPQDLFFRNKAVVTAVVGDTPVVT